MALPKYRTERRIWLIAFLLTVALHLATVVGVWMTRPFTPAPVEAQAPEPIQLVFAEEPPSEEPTTFSELPPDRADEAPERADLLSNVDSRARDHVEGGEEGAMPRLEGNSDAPHVRMEPGVPGPSEPASNVSPQTTNPETAEESPAGEPDAGAREEFSAGVGERRPEVPTESPQGTPDSPIIRKPPPSPELAPEREASRGGTQSMLLLQRPRGSLDFYQEEMDNRGGNAALPGDVSLNTLQWDYAPWLQKFFRDFIQHWRAPYAYFIGLTWGETLLELEINPQGELLRMDVLEETGQAPDRLRQSSLNAFLSSAPFEPLPGHFPEETLILRIRLIYPRVER